ncbi:glucose-6-phosphate isomerase [Mycoplasmopsis mucosicanis]|uniref:Glucose-6-phosphate isomerase n=1 Tax=Mycoplasmopsis mucosicanis TaxID=458208 RepID=A0A507SJK8_9BACT|nr:glucose-6-phosphate isomerase [Mycoplasmopsis mucosicanis]TQC51411.1 glucose-6-phosphate isomerase [Mycoplasmopsis mucosicanis]
MSKIELKAYNYYPDFSNENLIKLANDIIQGINYKTINSFENFGFHELTLNFGKYNFEEIKEISQAIIKDNIRDIVIFCDELTIQNALSGIEFVFKYDILAQNKIKYHFINSNDPFEKWFSDFQCLKSSLNFETCAFIYSKMSSFDTKFIEFIKVFVNYVQQNYGYWRVLRRSFLIAKTDVEEQLSFLEIDEDNKLIIPNILDRRYAFFSEINIILLYLKGLNINNLIEGYRSASIEFTSANLQFNYAFQYGYIRHKLKQEKNKCLNIVSNSAIKKSLDIFAHLVNSKDIKNGFWTQNLVFPQDIYSFAPYTLNMNHSYFATFFRLKEQRYDFRIYPELSDKDGVPKYKQNRLNEFNKLNNDGISTTLSNIANVSMIEIVLQSNTEAVLGALICFFYWAQIFEGYINNTNPF